MREVQVLSFNFQHQYTVEEVTIIGAQQGVFAFVLVDEISTSYLSLNCTSDDIVNALLAGFTHLQSKATISAVPKFEIVILQSTYEYLSFQMTFIVESESSILLSIDTTYLSGSNITATVTKIQKHSPLPSGTFVVSMSPYFVSTPIAYDADPTDFAEALSQNTAGITVEISSNAYELASPNFGLTWTITFISQRGDLPSIAVDTSYIQGPGFTYIISTIQNATNTTFWFNPIPAWMIELPSAWIRNSQKTIKDTELFNVELYSVIPGNGVIKAVCDGGIAYLSSFLNLFTGSEDDCAFTYSQTSTPIVSNITLSTDSSTSKSVISISGDIHITGKGFMLGQNSPIVLIGFQPCSIISFTDTLIVCNLEYFGMTMIEGIYNISVVIPDIGAAMINSNIKPIEFPVSVVSSVTPSTGSIAGGQIVSISGVGFSVDTLITIGSNNVPCVVKFMNNTLIRCSMPSLYVVAGNNKLPTSTNTAILDMYMNGYKLDFKFTYSLNLTPLVTSISPSLSYAKSSQVIITGSNFLPSSVVHSSSTNIYESLSVTIGSSSCQIMNISASLLICWLPRSRQFLSNDHVVNVQLYIPHLGLAIDSNKVNNLTSSTSLLPSISRGFYITGMNTTSGSVYGGNNLIINGIGFTESEPSRYTVTFIDMASPPEQDQHYTYISTNILNIYTPTSSVLCEVTQVIDNNQLVCTLPIFEAAISTSYQVFVNLNDITSICLNGDMDGCIYAQSTFTTPMITDYTISNTGNMVTLTGMYLSNKVVSAYLGAIPCPVISSTISTVAVKLPLSLPSGPQEWSIIVKDFGQSNSDVIYENPLVIYQVTTSHRIVSLGGGSIVTITGTGFDGSDCSKNMITMSLNGSKTSDISNILIPDMNIINCSRVSISFILPPLIMTSSMVQKLQSQNFVSVSEFNVSTIFSTATAFLDSDTSITYSTQYTPTASNFSSSSGIAGNLLKFDINYPTAVYTTPFDLTVSFGSQHISCVILSKYISTPILLQVTCEVPILPASDYFVYILSAKSGYAILENNDLSLTQIVLPSYTSTLSVIPFDSITHISSNMGGGVLTINGAGFSKDMNLTVCGLICNILQLSYDSVTCTLPQVITKELVSEVTSLQNTSANFIGNIPGTVFGSNEDHMHPVNSIYDDNYGTYFESKNSSCYIGLAIPTGFRAIPYLLRYFPKVNGELLIDQVVFEGSIDDGITYEPLVNISHSFDGWNYASVVNMRNQLYSHLRYREVNSINNCSIARLQFIGITVSLASTCPVLITSPSYIHTVSPGSVTFSGLQSTPFVSELSPKSGPSSGGTVVTIIGSNLIYSDSHNTNTNTNTTVYLSGSICEIISLNMTSIVCITSARNQTAAAEGVSNSINIVNSLGYALILNDVTFQYVDRWSHTSTWTNNELPIDGDLVVIPSHLNVILDLSTPILDSIIIEGSLIFDHSYDLNITANNIIVYGGLLQIGTSSAPYTKTARLILNSTSNPFPFISSGVLAVISKGIPIGYIDTGIVIASLDSSKSFGQVEIYGQPRVVSWTKLAKSALQGQSYIITSDPNDFKAGDVLIIGASETYSGSSDAPTYQSEQVIVLSSSHTGTGHKVNLTTPLLYDHYSDIITVEGVMIDARCEVALLTRNIAIEGDSNSNGHGVTIQAYTQSILELSYVEVRYCGILDGIRSKDCINTFDANSAAQIVISHSAIHNGYYGGISISSSNNAVIDDNLIYQVIGRGFALPTHDSHNNTFTDNLGMNIISTSLATSSDQTASVFYVASPFNAWVGNIAENAMFGFLLSFDSWSSVHDPIKQFTRQIVKLNVYTGIRIFPEYLPFVLSSYVNQEIILSNKTLNQYVSNIQTMSNIIFYRNGISGFSASSIGSIQVANSIFLENGLRDFRASQYTLSGTIPKFANVLNCTMIMSRNYSMSNGAAVGDFSLPKSLRYALSLPQSEYFNVEGVTIVNYGYQGVITVNNTAQNSDRSIQNVLLNSQYTTTSFSKMVFINTFRRVTWFPDSNAIFLDVDGSLTGQPTSMLTRLLPINNISDCVIMNNLIYDNSMLCNKSTPIRKLLITNISPFQSPSTLLVSTKLGSVALHIDTTLGTAFPVLNMNEYKLTFNSVNNGIQFSVHYSALNYVIAPNIIPEQVFLNVPLGLSYQPYSFETSYEGTSKLTPTRQIQLRSFGSSYFENNTLSMLFTNQNLDSDVLTDSSLSIDVKSKYCEFDNCYQTPNFNISNPMLWSQNISWQSGFIPDKNDDVYIDQNMWIVADISPPPLRCLYIYGKLTFLQSSLANILLSLQCMVIYGSIEIIGSNNGPYPGIVDISLSGIPSDHPKLFNSAHPTRYIKIYGKFLAKGQPILSPSISLNKTVYVGSLTIYLNSAIVDWKVGNEIVITPTSYYDSNSDTVVDVSSGVFKNSEVRIISSIQNLTSSVTVITIDRPLLYTHLCELSYGEWFCGQVGLLSRSITIGASSDSADPQSPMFGYGADLTFVNSYTDDNIPPYEIPLVYVDLESIALVNFGKAVIKPGISFSYQVNYPFVSQIKNSVFYNSFNIAIRLSGSYNVALTGNVLYHVWRGAIYVDSDCQNFTISDNLVVSHTRTPIYFYNIPCLQHYSGYLTFPISAIISYSSYGIIRGNTVSGSVDSGFGFSQANFLVNANSTSYCVIARGGKIPPIDLTGVQFSVQNNEAFACLVGLFLITFSPHEVSSSSCLVIPRVKVWRNGHVGLLSSDTVARAIVINSIVAENEIGISFNFFTKDIQSFFSVANSKIIGSLNSNLNCVDFLDCAWPTSYESINTVLSDTIYKRVGIMYPQFSNAPKTCTFSSSPCAKPHIVLNSCSLPYEKRYGLPVSGQYSEMHIFNNIFAGFCHSNGTSVNLPRVSNAVTAAIALNPTQTDLVPQMRLASNIWLMQSSIPSSPMTSEDFFGMNMNIELSAPSQCIAGVCVTRAPSIVFNDDGSTTSAVNSSYSLGGQFYFNSKSSLPSQCINFPALGPSFQLCPTQQRNTFIQRRVVWNDNDPRIRPPLLVSRVVNGNNYTYAGFPPQEESCSNAPLFNRIQLFMADHIVHDVNLLGIVPFNWNMQYNPSSYNKTTMLRLHLDKLYQYNVFTSTTGSNSAFVPPLLDREPNYLDVAGANYRDFSNGTLTILFRGGLYRKFFFQRVPIVALSITTAYALSEYDVDAVTPILISLLHVNSQRISILLSESSPTFVEYYIKPNFIVATSLNDVALQVSELSSVIANLTVIFKTGQFQQLWNRSIVKALVHIPVVPVGINETFFAIKSGNSSFNVSSFRQQLISYNDGKDEYLVQAQAVSVGNTPSAAPNKQTPPPILPSINSDSLTITLLVIFGILFVFCSVTVIVLILRRVRKNRQFSLYDKLDIYELFSRFGVTDYDSLSVKLKDEVKIFLQFVYSPSFPSSTRNRKAICDLIQSCSILELQDREHLIAYAESLAIVTPPVEKYIPLTPSRSCSPISCRSIDAVVRSYDYASPSSAVNRREVADPESPTNNDKMNDTNNKSILLVTEIKYLVKSIYKHNGAFLKKSTHHMITSLLVHSSLLSPSDTQKLIKQIQLMYYTYSGNINEEDNNAIDTINKKGDDSVNNNNNNVIVSDSVGSTTSITKPGSNHLYSLAMTDGWADEKVDNNDNDDDERVVYLNQKADIPFNGFNDSFMDHFSSNQVEDNDSNECQSDVVGILGRSKDSVNQDDDKDDINTDDDDDDDVATGTHEILPSHQNQHASYFSSHTQTRHQNQTFIPAPIPLQLPSIDRTFVIPTNSISSNAPFATLRPPSLLITRPSHNITPQVIYTQENIPAHVPLSRVPVPVEHDNNNNGNIDNNRLLVGIPGSIDVSDDHSSESALSDSIESNTRTPIVPRISMSLSSLYQSSLDQIRLRPPVLRLPMTNRNIKKENEL